MSNPDIKIIIPELPECDSYCTHADCHEYDVYTADQMRAYAEAAVLANVQAEDVVDILMKMITDYRAIGVGIEEPVSPMIEQNAYADILSALRGLLENATPPDHIRDATEMVASVQAADAKDAQRYRWARKCDNGNAMYCIISSGDCAQNMDAAIDAALQSAGDNGDKTA